MADCAYCGAPVGFGATRCNTETCYLQRIRALESELAELRKREEHLNGRRRESRMLLARFVKRASVAHKGAYGLQHLAQFTEVVRDYLSRTAEPRDILRSPRPKPQHSHDSSGDGKR